MKQIATLALMAMAGIGTATAQLIVTNEQFLPGTNASFTTITQRDMLPGEDFSIDNIDSNTTVYLLNEQTTTYTMPKSEIISNYDGSELVVKEGSEILSLLYHLEIEPGPNRRANIQFDVEVPSSWFGAQFGSAAGFGSAATTAALRNTDYVSPGVFWSGGARGMEGVNELPKVTALGGGSYRVTVNANVADCCMDEMRIFAIRANPWGYFNGLIENANPTTLNTGMARITVNKVNQSFSAVYYYNGRYYRNRGQLDSNFAWAGSVAGRAGYPPIDVAFSVQFNTPKNYIEIVGTVDSSTFSAPLAPHIDPLCPSPAEGDYTALTLPPTGADAATPGGYGYFVGDVNRFGRLSLVGRAGDGMTLGRGSASVYIRPDSTVPFFMNTNYFIDGLDAQRASMLGDLVFRDVPGVSDFDGSLRWTKPEGALSFRFRHYREHYAGGFELENIAMIGSRYDASASLGATRATLSGGNLPGDIVSGASVTPGGVTLDSPDAVVRKWYPQNGSFIGRFAHAGMITPRGKIPWSPFYGVAFQKQDLAAGLIIGIDEMGEIIIE